ncbi:MAG: response regulator [Candidatus Binatia bacterium]
MTAGSRYQKCLTTIIARLWERHKGAILDRVADLEQATIALLEGSLDDSLRGKAEREAHKLAGSLGTFGFHKGSELAKEIEHVLRNVTLLSPKDVISLSELIVSLRRELEQAVVATQASHEPTQSDDWPLLLLIDNDKELTEQLAMEAAARGIRVEAVANLSEARDSVSHKPPDVVLLDLQLPEGTGACLGFLEELTRLTPPVPVLVLTRGDSFTDRVEIARLGGRGFLLQSLSPSQMLEPIIQILNRLNAIKTKVMAVDDDPQVLAIIQTLLKSEKIKVISLENPLRFWELLEETSPDLVVLDLEMPHVRGIELCRMMRNDARWNAVPVLFLTAHKDSETVHSVFAAGADDYVSKPIVGPELVTRILNRLERTRLQRNLAETDALTGVANREKATQDLRRFLRLADNYNQPLSLAVLDVDHLEQLNERHSHSAGDAVLRYLGQLLMKSFRAEDVVARWTGNEFVIGMYGLSRDDGVQRAAEVLESLRQEEFTALGDIRFRVSFSAGVAEYPEDGAELESLYRAAHEALRQAKANGRDKVLPVGWRPNQPQGMRNADVVLVDDDEVLASVLLHTLETRGYRTHWIKDGPSALKILGGTKPTLRPRVVLLDVDLPGLDGLSLLRHLSRDGLLRRTRVIMLTVRSAESEVLAALEAGAFDHVAKPFSIPVLVQHIRGAMQA